VQRFRGGLAFKAHRLLYHSTLGLRVIKKKKIGTWFLVVAHRNWLPVIEYWTDRTCLRVEG